MEDWGQDIRNGEGELVNKKKWSIIGSTHLDKKCTVITFG